MFNCKPEFRVKAQGLFKCKFQCLFALRLLEPSAVRRLGYGEAGQVGRSLLTIVNASAKRMREPGIHPGGLCPLYTSPWSWWIFLDASEKTADPHLQGYSYWDNIITFTSTGTSHLRHLISRAAEK